NRPVFNHNLGGTAWETLPIDINDVERIEIVRGPSAPLFGPNAVSGVINIITKKVTKGTHAYATIQYGTQNTAIGQASFGKQVTDKLSLAASANFQEKDRFQNEYFNTATGEYEDLSSDAVRNQRYPHINRAMQKWGANAFANYSPNQHVDLDLTIGLQRSDAQKAFLAPKDIPLTTNISESEYVNLAAKIYGLAVRTSYLSGMDELNVGSTPNGYDYHNFDINAEYAFKISDKILITPGLAYQNVNYSDEGYTVPGDNRTGYLNGSYSIGTTAAFVRADINVTKNWRFLTALRGDKFSTPDKTTFAYEFASTYKIGNAHLIRAAVTRSNTGSFIAQNYANFDNEPAPGYIIGVRANKDYDLVTIRMVEIGYRVKMNNWLQMDLDLFRQTGSNFGAYLVHQLAPAPPFPPFTPTEMLYENLPTEAVQTGGTISLNAVPSEKLQFKPFITIQETTVKDLPDAFVSTAIMPVQTYKNGKHENTPAFYGGFFLTYKFTEKLYFNVNGYYFKSHTQYDKSDPTGAGEQANIKGKVLVNVKLNYMPLNKFNVFINARNILNEDSHEFFGTDKTGSLYMVGASYSLN
ncbi:MAG TPA: TonB-dependent receptor, partial [Chryseolinea sp.]|nr:TonB-dependent receptor [Chryseolinea sp.]